MRLAALALLLLGSVASAQSFVRTHVPGRNVCLYWPVRVYEFHVDAAGYTRNDSTLTPRSEFAAIDAAVDNWLTVASGCSDFRFVRGADVTNPQVGYVQGEENANVITFRESSCLSVPEDDPCQIEGGCANKHRCWDHGDLTIALTTTTHRVSSGQILDADIEFNAAPQSDGNLFLFSTVSSPPCDPGAPSLDCVANDAQNTITHELGHAIGLDHSEVAGSTMEASAPLGETKKRIIDSGTAEGFCTIYPRGGSSPVLCDESDTSTQILAVSRGSPGPTAIGCGVAAGGSGLSVLAALLALPWLARSRRRGDKEPAPRAPSR